MKKVVVIILLILPVFLMVSISLAARLIVLISNVPVESVEFVLNDEPIERLELRKGETFDLEVRVLPEMASNKNVSFSMEENNVCRLISTQSGTVTALDYGSCRIVVVTEEKRLRAELVIRVVDRNVDTVTLSTNEITLRIGESAKLTASVLPITADDRSVTWSSSDTSRVTVDANGGLYAKAQTEPDEPVVITVKSNDGGITAECLVTVLSDMLPLTFHRIGDENPIQPGAVIVTTSETIDLMAYLRFDSDLIDPASIEFGFVSETSNATLSDTQLTFLNYGIAVRIRATATIDGITYTTEASFRRNAS